MLKKLISFFTKHSTHASTFLFFAGFLFDSIMLPDLEDPIARYIGLGYLCIIAFLIAFRELIVASNKATKTEQKLYSLATFGIAYCSGSALSFVFIYAIRSAALSVSWPLFLIFIICILANEFVSTHNFRLTLDIGILFVAMLFFTVFNVPLLLKQQNDMTFAISVLITVVISILYIACLQFTSEGAREETGRGYALSVGIPMFFGMLYFLNVIPAVPLSLKEGGVYHSVVHTDAKEFIAKEEIDTRSFSKYRTPVYHITDTDNGVYFFSAVNAPTLLTAPLSHVWEVYDESAKQWNEKARITFTLAGGRDDGYRAFSQKEFITEGLWRVTVKVDDNRIVGRVTFRVIKSQGVSLKEVKL